MLLALNALLETHAVVHISNDKTWTTLNDPPENHDRILEHCEYHLVYLGKGNFIELVERQRPLIVIHSDDDVKTVELGQLTFDEEETLNSVISKGLDVVLNPKSALVPARTPLGHTQIKQELPDTTYVDAATKKSCIVDQIPVNETQHNETDNQSKKTRRELVVKLQKLAIDEKGDVIMTNELKQNMLSTSGYDSEETIIYNPGEITPPKSSKLTEHATESKRSKAHKSRRSTTKSGFHISVHRIKCKRKRTYLGCKIPGCSLKFPSVRDWNSHHRLVHHGIQLTCTVCKKRFNTPSFLRDHVYVHSKINYKCEKCDKNFLFKSLYRIHVRTHLRSKIHKCFAGSCNKEYKWPLDLHRHIQTHLKRRYDCNICDYSNTQEYLLK